MHLIGLGFPLLRIPECTRPAGYDFESCLSTNVDTMFQNGAHAMRNVNAMLHHAGNEKQGRRDEGAMDPRDQGPLKFNDLPHA